MRAVILLLCLSVASLVLADRCVPVTGTSTLCSLPAMACTSSASATSIDGTVYNAANYGAVNAQWNALKSTACPNAPHLVGDYPVSHYCPDSCTSDYSCLTAVEPDPPMCHNFCVECFGTTTCTEWLVYSNVSSTDTLCYSSYTHAGKSQLQVDDVTPSWGYVSGNQRIVITGCGFTTYSNVKCMFGDWPAENSVIVDDKTIHCWTPVDVAFPTVPRTTSLTLVFDGTPAITRALPEFWWGPMITGIAPTQVMVAGGQTLTISGHGFGEYETTNVTIDGVSCTGVSTSDTTITCTLPAGSINQNAIVDVYFNGIPYYFLHSFWAVHYGPILTTITPTCGHIVGGDVITLSGTLFDDPVLNNPRVEFLINGEWYLGTQPTKTGGAITVRTPIPPINVDMFDVDVQVVVFGSDPRFSRVPGSTSFHYGALLFTVSPTIGYVDGGETVTITGCAFRDYNNTDIHVWQGSSNVNALCTDGSITIDSDSQIRCTSVSTANQCFTAVGVEVSLTNGDRLPSPSQKLAGTGYSNSWWWGPYVLSTTITPQRGPWSVSTTVITIQGIKMGRQASTLFSSAACTFNDLPGSPSTTATVSNGQTQVTCSVPAFQFNRDTTVGVSFSTPCQAQFVPHSNYHYGPYCTGVSPTFGYIGGGTQISLTGVGFNDVDWNNKALRTRFCIGGNPCNWEQNGATVTVNGATGGSTVSPNFALAPRNGLGANRAFGDQATVTIYFDADSGISNETYSLTCGSFRYGPIVTSTNPRKGPIGPRADHSPNTPVTVTGAGFNDPLVKDNIRVAFGGIHGEAAVTTGDSSISVKTLWGATANTDKHLYVYFDTCNTTVSEQTFHWGPIITGVYPVWGYNGYWNTRITISGWGFEEWLYPNSYTDAICVIDSTYGTNTAIVSNGDGSYNITCDVPVKEFGTQAQVQVVFGKNCRGLWDWRQALTSPMDIFYRPEITSIDPTVGYTSGSKDVTIHGYGLGGWHANVCYFGHYQGALVHAPASLNDYVVCTTPSRRADFNSDVTVHVQMELTPHLGYHAKVWAPQTYHYGPLCWTVSPTAGYTRPASSYAVSLFGIGFQDEDTFNNTHPVVQFGGVNVTVTNGGVSDGLITVENIPNANCLTNRTVTIWWDSASRTISCPNYFYGPIVDQSLPDLGWEGDSVTVSGSFFDDPQLYSGNPADVKVVFGSSVVAATSVTANTITCNAPQGNWLTDPLITVRWQATNTNLTCVSDSQLHADNFHYGPIITAVVPTFGYVYGRTPVTILGRGFDCCKLETAKTLCRFGSVDTTSADGATTFISSNQVNCFSIGRGAPEFTGPQNAETTKFVGLRFNDTNQNRVIDTSSTSLPRQGQVPYFYGPLINSVTPTFGFIRGDVAVTILGAGFRDPFFTNPSLVNTRPECVFTNGNNQWTYPLTNDGDWGDNYIVCRTPYYVHKCGDANDVITVAFAVNTSTNAEFVRPTDNRLTHHYGPLVTSITPTRGYMKGGDSVTVNAAGWDEWFGKKAKIVVANREINDQWYPITTNQIVFTTSKGSFDHSGPVSVILDYKNDALTTLPYYWHWHPYVTEISNAWAIESGSSTIAVEGGGFCEYDLVTCSFGGAMSGQSDIAYDHVVVCQAPYTSPAVSAVTLTFSDFWNDCGLYAGTPDAVSGPTFTAVGLTGINPTSGPWVGGTTVSISGQGFQHFSDIKVYFGDLPAVSPVGNSTSSTGFTVVTPAAPSQTAVQIFVELTYSFVNGETVTYTIPDRSEAPVHYYYGYPYITAISPATADVDVAVDVTLTGDFFNGGVQNTIKCYWGTNKVTTPIGPISVKSKTDTTVVCTAPTYATGVEKLGAADVWVTFDGQRRSNMVNFEYTQTAAITSISPTQGAQYGADVITINGNNFNAGLSYLCKFGEVVTASSSVAIGTTGGSTTAAATTATATSTTGGSNATTTTGGTNATTSTTGAAGTTTGATNGSAPAVRSAESNNDQIICRSPRSLAENFPAATTVQVSLDGGLTWSTSNAGNTFTYLEGFDSTTTSAASSVVPVSFMVALVLLLVSLMM